MYDIFESLLNKYGVTPYRVSKETGISTATLSDWKNGRSTPKPDKLQKIADYFGVPLSYLLTGNLDEKISQKAPELALKDEREIGYDLDRIMKELENDVNGPFYYKGRPITNDELDILVKALELGLSKFRNDKRKK